MPPALLAAHLAAIFIADGYPVHSFTLRPDVDWPRIVALLLLALMAGERLGGWAPSH